MDTNTKTSAQAPKGVSHIVLNVRDIEESHRFWTDVMGFVQTGELTSNPRMKMRFYSGGSGHHHDVALAEVTGAAEAPSGWSMAPKQIGLNHVAIEYPDRDSWMRQVEHLQACGVTFHIRGDHGMSHSVYISDPNGHGIEVLYDLPQEVWEGDLNAAFNYFKPLPTSGPEALQDSTENHVFSAPGQS